jgi:RimJ/RimL family protein N-acetyltransferase
MKDPTLRTERLLLRRWADEDRTAFAQISADPEVMRYRLAPLSRRESDGLIDETEASFDRNGFGLWAVERIEDGRLLGVTGFGISDFNAPFCPAVDVGWTLARDVWGHGFATEGAVAALDVSLSTSSNSTRLWRTLPN